eukprot:gene11097-7724_t
MHAEQDLTGKYELLRFDGEPASMQMKLQRGILDKRFIYYCTIRLGKTLRGRVYLVDGKMKGTLQASRTESSTRQLKMERIFKAGLEEGYAFTVHQKFNLLVLESDGHVWEFEAQEKTEIQTALNYITRCSCIRQGSVECNMVESHMRKTTPKEKRGKKETKKKRKEKRGQKRVVRYFLFFFSLSFDCTHDLLCCFIWPPRFYPKVPSVWNDLPCRVHVFVVFSSTLSNICTVFLPSVVFCLCLFCLAGWCDTTQLLSPFKTTTLRFASLRLHNSSRSMRRTGTNSSLPTNDFHQVRLSEYRRDHAITEQSAAEDQVPVSYFVPTLQSICADLLAKNFNTMPDIDVLKTEHPKLFEMIVSRVPTEEEAVPLSVSVPRIEDETYWKRACEARWSLGQISKFAKERLVGKETGWKELFLEHSLCDYLLSLRSGYGQAHGGASELRAARGAEVQLRDDDDDNVDVGISEEEANQLAQLCQICKDYVHRIDLPCQYSHIKLYDHLFSKLPEVYELRLSYGSSNAGIGFHRRMIGFSDDDARAISSLLARYHNLQSLRLPSNRLSTLQVNCICSTLVENRNLRVLDLSNNALNDEAIQTVAIIISQAELPMEELYLQNNNIRGAGALALAEALEMNKSLRILQLQQNRIPDSEGGPELLNALGVHPSLAELHLGSNCIGPKCVEALHDVLPKLTALTVLNVSGNRHLGGSAVDTMNITIDTEGSSTFSPKSYGSVNERSPGKMLIEALEANSSLRQVDVRMCGFPVEEVAQMEKIIYERVRKLEKLATIEKENEMKEQIRILVDEKITRTRGQNQPFCSESVSECVSEWGYALCVLRLHILSSGFKGSVAMRATMYIPMPPPHRSGFPDSSMRMTRERGRERTTRLGSGECRSSWKRQRMDRGDACYCAFYSYYTPMADGETDGIRCGRDSITNFKLSSNLLTTAHIHGMRRHYNNLFFFILGLTVRGKEQLVRHTTLRTARMKLSLRGVGFLLVFVIPSFLTLSVVYNWVVFIECGLRYLLGPAASRPVLRLFHRYHSFVEVMWMFLVVVAVELVTGTQVALSYAGPKNSKSSIKTLDLRQLVEPPAPGKTKIIMLNHHSRVDWLYLYLLVLRTSFPSKLRVVLKDDLKKIPCFGVAMQLFAYIFLSRSWANDEPYLRQMVETLKWLETSSVVQIYPEGTDLSKSSLEKSQAYAAKNDLPQFMYVLNPRTRGLVALKEMFGYDRVESIINVTLGYTYAAPGLRPNEASLVNGQHARKIHFLVQEYPFSATPTKWSAPLDNIQLEEWTHRQFATKEELLSRFYNTSPVGFDEADVKAVLGADIHFLQRDPDQTAVGAASNPLHSHMEEFGWAFGVAMPVLQWIIIPIIVFWVQCYATGFPALLMALIDVLTMVAMHKFQASVDIQRLLFSPSVAMSKKSFVLSFFSFEMAALMFAFLWFLLLLIIIIIIIFYFRIPDFAHGLTRLTEERKEILFSNSKEGRMNRSRYEPHDDTTRQYYEDLLQVVQRCLPPGCLEEVEDIANSVLAIVCAKDTDGLSAEATKAQRQRQLETLLDATLKPDMLHQLLSYGRHISDYVVDSAGAQAQEDGGPLSNSDDDDNALTTGRSALHKDKGLQQFAFSGSTGAGEDDLEGFLRDEDGTFGERHFLDGAGEEGPAVAPIPFEEVACNANYLKDTLRRLFPGHTADECATQAQRLLDYLSAIQVDTLTLETQLTAFLGEYDDEAVSRWIGDVCSSRWDIVYGLRRATATSEKERVEVMKAMERHGREDRQAEMLYQRLTGKEVQRDRETEDGEEGGGEQGSVKRPLRYVDIASCIFPEERSPYQHRRVLVPPGTKKMSYATHDEVTVPPVLNARPADPLVRVESLPPWCHPAFKGIETLNPMQSRVFHCAFETDENMLISAPTGAGKTNVALLSMLRAIERAKKRDGSINLRDLKMVYVAPMKALVQEVVRTFSERLGPLGLEVAELSGDASTTQAQLMNTQLIVATPEKWDVVTRKSVELGVASRLKLLILDEVHLLHNERGAVLEGIVARTFLQQEFRGHGGIRCVGLSATLPNWPDVAAFLQVDRERESTFVFDSTYRPIPLEQSFCAVKREEGKPQTATMNAVVYDKVMEGIDRDEQTLVFVHSRKDTVFTAGFLQARVQKENRSDAVVRPGSQSSTILQEAALGNISHALQKLLPRGFGIHHAGLSKEERAMVEELFAQRHIKVLVCTSTLAWGVNLPANQVIIKGTRVFNAAKGKSELLSALDVLQMFGRAGRAGFGSSLGRAAIITSAEDLHYYLSVLNQRLPIESHLMKRIVDMFNAEVVLGHIQSIAEGVRWLQRSYLYVRMRQEPELYGARRSDADPLLLHHLECIAHTCCEELRKARMTNYDAQRRKVDHTPYGRIASYCYVTAASMSAFLQHLSSCMQEPDLFRLFAMSSEFSQIPVRREEQAQVRQLLDDAPVPVREGAYAPLAKINVLLQCYISRKTLEGLPLMSEIGYVRESAQRILRALFEIAIQKEFGRTARQLLDLYLAVLHQQWIVESPIRQVEGIVPEKEFRAILPLVERIRLPWEVLRTWSAEDWEEKLNHDRRGKLALELVQAVPHYKVEAACRPLTRAMLYVDVEIVPDFVYHPSIHSPPSRVLELLLLVEDMGGRILHTETVLLPLECVTQRWPYSCPPVVVPIPEPRPTYLIVHCASTHWLHCTASASVCLLNVQLPDVAPPLREVERAARAGKEAEEEALDVSNTLAKYQLQGVAASLFPFTEFYAHQREVVETIMECEDSNMFIGVPPGGGKTALAEMFVLQFLLSSALRAEEQAEAAKAPEAEAGPGEARKVGGVGASASPHTAAAQTKLLYLTVNEDVASRRYMDWACRLEPALQAKVVKLDAFHDATAHLEALTSTSPRIIVATGATLLPLVRREEPLLLRDVTHIVVDHLHLLRTEEGRAMEECIARLQSGPPYLTCGGAQRARLLALSYPLISSVEVCRWLKIYTSRQFNFSNACRQLHVRVEGLELPNARIRAETGIIGALQLLLRQQYARLPCVIFVPTERDAEEVARRVLLRCRPPHTEVRDTAGGAAAVEVEDPRLAVLLESGVGYFHRNTSPADELALLERLYSGEADTPLLLVCAFQAANRLPAAAFNVAIITTTERVAADSQEEAEVADGPLEVVRPVKAAALLEMASRAALEATVFCPISRRWAWSKLLNDPLPLESSMRYPENFADSINAAVARRRVKTKVDVLRLLKTHYFLYHLKSNPHFYDVPRVEDISRFATALTFRVVEWLSQRGCLRVEGEREGEDNPHALLLPLARGLAVAEHGICLQSVEGIDMALEQMRATSRLTVAGVWRAVTAAAAELSTNALGDVSTPEDPEQTSALFTIARLLPEKFHVQFHNLDFKEEGIKLFLLVLAGCAGFLPPWLEDPIQDHPFGRAPLEPHDAALLRQIPQEVALRLVHDIRTALPLVLRVLTGVVRVMLPSAAGGPWLPVRYLMHLAQCVPLQCWIDAPSGHDDVVSLEASGGVEEADEPGAGAAMHFVVACTATLRAGVPPAARWWASCVVSPRDGTLGEPRVLAVESLEQGPTPTLEARLRFPVSALDDLNLDEMVMTAVLTSQSRRVEVEAEKYEFCAAPPTFLKRIAPLCCAAFFTPAFFVLHSFHIDHPLNQNVRHTYLWYRRDTFSFSETSTLEREREPKMSEVRDHRAGVPVYRDPAAAARLLSDTYEDPLENVVGPPPLLLLGTTSPARLAPRVVARPGTRTALFFPCWSSLYTPAGAWQQALLEVERAEVFEALQADLYRQAGRSSPSLDGALLTVHELEELRARWVISSAGSASPPLLPSSGLREDVTALDAGRTVVLRDGKGPDGGRTHRIAALSRLSQGEYWVDISPVADGRDGVNADVQRVDRAALQLVPPVPLYLDPLLPCDELADPHAASRCVFLAFLQRGGAVAAAAAAVGVARAARQRREEMSERRRQVESLLASSTTAGGAQLQVRVRDGDCVELELLRSTAGGGRPVRQSVLMREVHKLAALWEETRIRRAVQGSDAVGSATELVRDLSRSQRNVGVGADPAASLGSVAAAGAGHVAHHPFYFHLFAMLLRYQTLFGPRGYNQGPQAAVPPPIMRELQQSFGTQSEAFASPLNVFARHTTFCSLFPDVDAAFGSMGSFFDLDLPSGHFEVNPPFDAAVLRGLHAAITSAITASNQRRDDASLLFVVVLPSHDLDPHESASPTRSCAHAAAGPSRKRSRSCHTADPAPSPATAVERALRESGHCLAHTLCAAEEAGYVDGHQHLLRSPFFRIQSPTRLIVLGNNTARSLVPDAAERLGEVRRRYRQVTGINQPTNQPTGNALHCRHTGLL